MSNKITRSLYALTLWLAVTLAMISASTLSFAQSDFPPGRLLLTGMIELVGWSSNESYLKVSLDYGQTEYLDITSEQFAKPPIPTQLTDDELTIFGIDTSHPGSQVSHYVISPDGAYVAFDVRAGSEYQDPLESSCEARQLRIANRQTKLSTDLPIVVSTPTAFRWNYDSRGLVIEQIEGCEGPAINGPFAYVTNMSPTLTNLRTVILREIEQLTSDIDPPQLHAVSRDGAWLLASTIAIVDGSRQVKLILLNVLDSDQTSTITENFVGLLTASLENGMPTAIFVLSDAGLTKLNLTGQQIVLNSALKTTGDLTDYSPENYVRQAFFSPSGRWLAYTHVDEVTGEESLYLLDMNDVLNPNRPTPTIAPTFTPIGS